MTAGGATGLLACWDGLACGLTAVAVAITGAAEGEMLDTLIGTMPLMLKLISGITYIYRIFAIRSIGPERWIFRAYFGARWAPVARWRTLLIVVLTLQSTCAAASGGPLGIDSELPLDTNGAGPWIRSSIGIACCMVSS